MAIRHFTASEPVEASESDRQANADRDPETGGVGPQPAVQTRVDSTTQAGARKRRRRHRAQKGKRRRPQNAPHVDVVSRERIFQDIEGLLRQIREQAEESASWSEAQLNEITQTVTAFTRSLEQEGDPISPRAHGEYQRIRDKLSQALKG